MSYTPRHGMTRTHCRALNKEKNKTLTLQRSLHWD